MKKWFCALMAAVLAICCAGCAADSPAASAGKETTTCPEVYSPDEYMLYQNIFYKDYAKDAVNKPVVKEGVFATVYDAYNQRQRYYVWGYYDKTKCCDWQWEFVPEKPETLPAPGSLIKVSGTFVANDMALDKYWIFLPTVETKTVYTGPQAELNMGVMSGTLERVQILNILYRSEAFEGKSFIAYGRVLADKIQDPYYNGSWQIPYSWDGTLPGLDVLCSLSGKVQGGTLAAVQLAPMES